MLCGNLYQSVSFIASAFIMVFIIIKKMSLPYHTHSTKAGTLSIITEALEPRTAPGTQLQLGKALLTA